MCQSSETEDNFAVCDGDLRRRRVEGGFETNDASMNGEAGVVVHLPGRQASITHGTYVIRKPRVGVDYQVSGIPECKGTRNQT